MLFQSLQFAIFFPIVYGLYLLLPHKGQNRMLLLASYIFYGAWDWRYCGLLAFSTITDYLCGLGLSKFEEEKTRKRLVAVSVIVNVSLLCIFKYYDFFASSFQEFMGNFGLVVHPYFLNVALPIGISFYTFQTMSYTIDAYRKKVEPARNFWDFALYVSFFPQLIAGPIERGARLLPQILNPRVITREKIHQGIYLFIWGLFLKIFIADNLAKLVDPVFAANGQFEGILVFLATYAFAIQIYCDFAGYSFMAIGLGKLMGVELMENFKRPYFSKNISEFWRRWHISLSSWFRDYVFSPFYVFVEKRKILKPFKLRRRHAIAFFITLLVTEYLLGLWHGAGWNFGMFGVYHALVIWAYYAYKPTWDKMPTFLQIFLTFNVACVGWLIFRSPTLGQAIDMGASLFTNFWAGSSELAGEMFLQIILFSAILVVVQVFEDRKDDTFVLLRLPVVAQGALVALIAILVVQFGDFNERPFIYFQF